MAKTAYEVVLEWAQEECGGSMDREGVERFAQTALNHTWELNVKLGEEGGEK